MNQQPLPRIAFNRREAAEILGVSPDTIKKAKAAGRIRAKSTSHDDKGKATGKDLYTLDDLQAWFNQLGDA